MLAGAYEVLDHAEASLGISVGQTTEDGEFTLEEAECLAGCDKAPCVQVNHRFFGPLGPDGFDRLIDDLRSGRLDDTVPAHGTLSRVYRNVGLPALAAKPARAGDDGATSARSQDRCRRDHEGPPHRHLAGRPRGLVHPRALPGDRWLRGTAQGPDDDAGGGRGGGQQGEPARAWGSRLPGGAQMVDVAPGARSRYLVVNGDESEPATFKDHMLIERDPHQIIEGTAIAAYATGAEQAFIYCRGEFALGLERLQQACNEAYAHGALGANIFGTGYALDIVIHPGAGAYICGEETALLESLEGKRGFPRIKPPFFPAAVGLYGEPTVVNNVETVSNLPWIISNGADAFTALGEGSSTGTRLFALSGRVEHPGWFEIEMSKTTFRDLIFDPSLGGGIPGGRQLRAFIPGGVSAPWFGPDQLDLVSTRTRSARRARCSALDRS